jgi:plastocyanin
MEQRQQRGDNRRPPSGESDGSSATRRRFVTATAGTVVGATGAAAAQEESTSDGRTIDVAVGPGGELVFDPERLEIPPGTTVRFVWKSDLHNVVVESQPTDADWSGTAGGPGTTYDTGHEYSHTFDVEGTYEYYCAPHRTSGMTGTIVVSADATVPPAPVGGSPSGGGPDSLLVTGVGLGLTAVVVAAVYRFGWKSAPDARSPEDTETTGGVPARDQEDDPELGVSHGGPMYEADVPERELESVDNDAFDPVGTGALLVGYFLLVALLWLFMFFVEFLGNGPEVIG